MTHGAAGEIEKGGAEEVGGFSGMSGSAPEGGFGIGEAKGFEFYGIAGGVFADENEVAIVGDEDLAVFRPVAADLSAVGGKPGVVGGGFDFDHTARGLLRDIWIFVFSAFELLFGKEAAIGDAGAAIAKLEDAGDFGLKRFADFVEK